MRILVIEDDGEAADYLVRGLTESGHRVDLAAEGREGLDRASHDSFDAMIIDRMLPGLDGLSIIAALRAAKNQTPVLVLSALGDVEERVKGLRSGCEDRKSTRLNSSHMSISYAVFCLKKKKKKKNQKKR